jgi:hypothetical protein
VKFLSAFKRKWILAALVCCVCLPISGLRAGLAQNPDMRRREEQASVPKVLPTELMQQVKMIGARMRNAGREESDYDGQLTNDTGTPKHLRVDHQISGVLHVEYVDEKTELSFDGDLAVGIKNRSDESLVDTFVLDTPEGMIYALRNGAAAQLLGRGFNTESKSSEAQLPHYDIYEITAHERTHPGGEMRTRRYYFDSDTGLLASTRYIDRSGVAVEARFMSWGEVDGSLYPSRIERYEEGRLIFAFVAGSIAGRPKQAETKSK